MQYFRKNSSRMQKVALLTLISLVFEVHCFPWDSNFWESNPWDSWPWHSSPWDRKPNFVVMLMDDVGWGDLGVYGNPSRETPNIDKMAANGMLFTDFYTAAPACSPSRASFLTGRLPIRNGFYSSLRPGNTSLALNNVVGGIADSEILLSEVLKQYGYKTKFVGKWHLGHQSEYLPYRHGFDDFFGSTNNHFGPFDDVQQPNVPLFKNDTMAGRYFQDDFVISEDGVSDIVQQFLNESISFIQESSRNRDPFFLVWAPDATHASRTYASDDFIGLSERGRYGDALIEVDDGVARILNTLLEEHEILNTLVFFSSDNGGASYAGVDGGSNGPFLCGKFTNFEGGQRIPGIAYWPGRIHPQSISRPATLMDLFATFLELADIDMPTDRVYDSNSLVYTFKGEENIPDKPVFYYRGAELYAVRLGEYKAALLTCANNPSISPFGWDFCPGEFREGITTQFPSNFTDEPLLYHLGRDPKEMFPISPSSQEYIDAMDLINPIITDHKDNMIKGEAQFNYVDVAAYSWAPQGCEKINKCLPVPESNPQVAFWTF